MVSGEDSVFAAVRRDLDAIAERDAALATSGLATSALALAARIDDEFTSAASVAQCATALAKALDRLRELLPPVAAKDAVDELAAARAARTG